MEYPRFDSVDWDSGSPDVVKKWRLIMVNKKWRIQRQDPKTGFSEKVWFTGQKKDIPKGWKIVNHPDNGNEQ